MDSSHAFTEMTVQYLLELEWTARWVELIIMQTTHGQCWLPGPCWATSTEGSLSLNFLLFDIQKNVERWNMATEPVNFWQELRQGWHFRQPSELVHLKMFLKWLKPFGGYTTKRRRDGKSEWVEALRRKMDKNDKKLWRKTPRLTFETDSRQLWFLKRFIYNCLQKIYESANISGRLMCFALLCKWWFFLKELRQKNGQSGRMVEGARKPRMGFAEKIGLRRKF